MNTRFQIRKDGEEIFLQSPLLTAAGAKHFFATRIGGVSEGVFGGWNFAPGVGKVTDTEENVMENYRIAAEKLGLSLGDVCRSYQAHTAYCLTVDDTHRGVGTVKPKFDFGVDGLVSKTKDLLLSVRSADCVPVLLFDPKKQICAAVHAGWRGTVGGICGNAVKEMVSLGSDPKDILAAIGPCIGACCYQVGEEVYTAFFEAGDFAACFTPDAEQGKYLLDLTHANRLVLEREGLAPEHIDEAHTCTRCHGEYFFSHRRMGAERGTMSAFITV
jgi:YfiH family protein